jgi:hypothetical protein
VLSVAALGLIVGAAYFLGKGKRSTAWVAGALAIVVLLFLGKHNACPECRNGFSLWKRSLGRKLIE